MREGNPYLYAGWFVLDMRLLGFVLLVSLLLTSGLLAVFFRGRRWHEYVSAGFTVYVALVAALVSVFNWVAGYPVFRIEALFPFP